MSMEMSPRLSFSSDLPPSPVTSRLDHSLPLDPLPPSGEFDFSTTSFEAISSDHGNSTPADLLFSQGKLLPFRSSSSSNESISSRITKPPKYRSLKRILSKNQDDEDDDEEEEDDSCSRRSSVVIRSNITDTQVTQPPSLWYSITRSSSLSKARRGAGGAGICPRLPRSRSTGCNPDHRSRSRDDAKAYYYSGDRRVPPPYGNGVRISPVINVPAPFVTRGGSSGSNGDSGGGGVGTSSFFSYLLCNCRVKDHGSE